MLMRSLPSRTSRSRQGQWACALRAARAVPQRCPLPRLGPAAYLHVPVPLPSRLALSVSRELGWKPTVMNNPGQEEIMVSNATGFLPADDNHVSPIQGQAEG